MLSLDSSEWNDLPHAYGQASDIPALLRRLADIPDDTEEVWYELWGSLCHQGTPYPASYAALPHVIAIAAPLPPKARMEHLRFAGMVAAAADEVPAALDADYRSALARASLMVEQGLKAKLSVDDAACLLWVGVAFRGLQDAALALEPFVDEGTLQIRCPADLCGVGLWLDHEDEGWAPLVMEDDSGDGPSTEIEPPAQLVLEQDWTAQAVPANMAALAKQYGYPTVATKLELLMGTALCPKCREPFPLWRWILEPSEL